LIDVSTCNKYQRQDFLESIRRKYPHKLLDTSLLKSLSELVQQRSENYTGLLGTVNTLSHLFSNNCVSLAACCNGAANVICWHFLIYSFYKKKSRH
jgi:hypothetical protein